MKRAVCALTVAALITTYLWAINGTHADTQGWEEVDLRPGEPIHPARAWCNGAGCKWETTNPSSWGRMNEYLDHRDADHG